MNWLRNKKVKVAVHDGHFHADDVFAVAILSLHLNNPIQIFRTRGLEVYKEMDYLLDVGREYDPTQNKFDHHQSNVPKHENGIPYASCGLVWKEFGEKICGSKEVSNIIDKKIIQMVDAEDSGVSIYTDVYDDVEPYCFTDYIISLNPAWNEKDLNPDEEFNRAVEIVKDMLKREIKVARNYLLDKSKITEIYENSPDKRLIILDFDYSWKKVIKEYTEPLIVVRPVAGTWWASCVPANGEKFKNKMSFPLVWSGKSGKQLAEITGVVDAIFCHKDLFMCSAKTKEGAVAMAKIAIDNKE